MPKIVIMAGGTGGHVFPGLALANELKDRGWTIEWFGTRDRMEADTVPRHGYPIHFLDIAGVRGKGLLRKLHSPIRLIQAVLSARKILKQLSPDLVIGMGGYASGPGGLAAKSLNIPLFIHEQNAVFGLTNRLLAVFADKVFTGFDLTKKQTESKAPSNTIWVGNPVRAEFFESQAREIDTLFASNKITESENPPCNILITGGSLGAQSLNTLLPSIINSCCKEHNLKVWHQAGKGKLTGIEENYSTDVTLRVDEFIGNTADAYAWAEIIVCRAGALTVAEVSASGKPAIFVPLPIAVDDHQTKNARVLVEANAAYLVNQKDISERLEAYLKALLSDKKLRKTMGENAKVLAKVDSAKVLADYCQQEIGMKHD
ncbi:undecaprenyldiphospho-muramoylpentapeptide beta-N-acetylglucosaminyltransferase [Agaribacter flavus]|uniref:UDP-N-acetylglucosamine--N-acetylmuramyl-(pentapeptide) pyrophosphoryl-undecaprenol N-acetylglucosamine transferase n=1 Tax=Agaribacter flavus TaxID=1902781 RepID=A0ABV7FR40_9ALTE